MRDFYNETMGFPIYLDAGYWIEMKIGSTLLTLSQRGRPFEGPHIPDGCHDALDAAKTTSGFFGGEGGFDAAFDGNGGGGTG